MKRQRNGRVSSSGPGRKGSQALTEALILLGGSREKPPPISPGPPGEAGGLRPQLAPLTPFFCPLRSPHGPRPKPWADFRGWLASAYPLACIYRSGSQSKNKTGPALNLTMILFLDIDGVLHPDPAMAEEAFCQRHLLWQNAQGRHRLRLALRRLRHQVVKQVRYPARRCDGGAELDG